MIRKDKNNILSLIIFLFSSIGTSSIIIAQSLHMPAEIQQLMANSTFSYQLDSTIKHIVLEKEKFPIIEKGWQVITTNEGIQLKQSLIQTDETSEKYRKKAKDYLENKKYSKAIKLYNKALAHQPDNIELMKSLGKAYQANKKEQTAIGWYIKVIEQNHVDFEAHLQLAICFDLDNRMDLALKHITLAHIFNRNDLDILQILQKIYAKSGLTYEQWTLEPQYQIQKTIDGKILIQYQEKPWCAYASCKAVWENEANYRKEMEQMSASSASIIQEKECLFNALIEYERLESGKENFPALANLALALLNKKVNNYVLYEILSKRDPLLIYSLNNSQLEELIHYLLTIRVGKPSELE